MKKIFMFLVSFAAVSASFAQYNKQCPQNGNSNPGKQNGGYGNNKNDRYDNGRNQSTGYNSSRDLEDQIERLNRDYSQRMENISRDRRIRSSEKKRMIRALENERVARIRDLRERYYARNSRDNKWRF